MVSTAQDIMDRYGIDQDFAASIESLGNDLGVDPMYLANTMYAESRLDPSIKNEAGSGATGLIQFMPGTAANLGTTTDELSRMTPVEQMEYVRRYFSVDNFGAGRLRDLRNDPSQHNVNMAVFLPSMIGKPLDTQIPQEYWRQNGSIRTPGDYTRSAEKRVNEYIQSNPVDTQPDPVDTQTDEMLSEEQPEDSFRPENDSVSSDTGTPVGDQNEEALEVDDTIISEHEEKIRRGEAPKGSKPTKEGGYYTEGKYGFKTNPEGEVVADLDVSSLENVVTSIGERLRTILGNNEDSPENLRKAEGGSVEKEVKFGKKDDDDDVPDPPPGATPEEVADDIPAYLSTGEYVLPANVVRYIGLKNIADMHRMALAELQQMEDLGIIENVDENGYVEDDDDETEYMEPEGVVEVIVAEHHPKGLMSMGFADGGPVEAMVYVPGVGFVPQTQAATQPVKTEEESTPISKLRESGEDPQSGIAEQEEGTEKISAEEARSRAKRGLLGVSPLTGIAAAVNEVVSKDSALSAAGVSRDQFGNTTFGPPQEGPLGTSVASSLAGIMGNPGVSQAVKDHISTSLSNDQMSEVTDSMSDAQMSEVLDSIEAGFATQAADESAVGVDAFGGTGENEDEAAGIRRGGYVTRNGIMAVGYSGGGEVGDPEGGPGEPPAEREPEPEVVEEEKPTDLYEGYTYVDGIGYVPTSRRMTSDKPVESASLDFYDDALSIFPPSFLRTIYGLMSDPNKEV